MLVGTGRIIFEGVGPQFRNFFSLGFGAELFYSFVIIICSLMIYFGTKELYELSSYKGIKYFRRAFLFFAIAYFFRSFIKFVVLYFNIRIVEFSLAFGVVGILTQILFVYFSLMSIFYLLYSVMWKTWNGNSKTIYLFHAVAFAVAVTSILLTSPLAYLGLNFFILILVIFMVIVSYKDSRKKSQNLYWIYLLLFIFWILNIVDALVPRFFEGLQLFIYMISTGVFLLILYKVIKKTEAD